MKKQAQLATKIKEKLLPTGRRSFRLSPLRYLGTDALRKRSPEVYGKAIDMVDKADRLIRKTVSDQNINLAEMKRFGKTLSINNFVVSANRFQINQKLINKAIEKVKTIFEEIMKPYGTLDEAINVAIGKSPEKLWHTDKKDIDESDKYITEKLDKISKMYLDLTKTARIFDGGFIGGRYWKSKTESGRNFSKNFKILYLEFKKILDKNVEALKELDELRSIGDPSQYYKIAVKKIPDINTILNQPNIKPIWDDFSKSLNTVEFEIEPKPTDSTIVPAPAPAPAPVVPASTPAPVVPASTPAISPTIPDKSILPKNWTTFQSSGFIYTVYNSDNFIKITKVDTSKYNFENILNWINDTGSLILDSINFFIEKVLNLINLQTIMYYEGEDSYDKKYIVIFNLKSDTTRIKQFEGGILPNIYNDIKKYIESLKPKTSHKIFINNLEKRANAGTSPKDLAIYMLRYANKIDGIDTEYALKLTAIAENILLK